MPKLEFVAPDSIRNREITRISTQIPWGVETIDGDFIFEVRTDQLTEMNR